MHQHQQQPSTFSFVRSGRMALFCWRPLVRFNRLEQTAKKKKKKKKTAGLQVFSSPVLPVNLGEIFSLPLFSLSFRFHASIRPSSPNFFQ
jgi:hypothetical protein